MRGQAADGGAMGQAPIDHVPFLRLLGLRQQPAAEGCSRLLLPELRDDFCNMLMAAHGGVLMTLLDVAMARAATSRTDAPSSTVVTVQMSSHFASPGRGPLTAEGRVLHAGGSLATCEARVFDAGGRLVASSTGTFKYWRGTAGGVD